MSLLSWIAQAGRWGRALRGVVALSAIFFATGAGAADGRSVKIAVITYFSSGKIQLSGADYAVEKEGWLRQELEKQGYALEWYPVANAAVGPLTNEAFSSRAIQFANYSDLPSIILNAAGAGVRTTVVVPGASPSDGYLLVPAGSTAKSIEDLKGKRLAIHKGRPWELTLLRLLDSRGLSYNDFQIYNINLDAAAAAVATGAVDAFFTIQPYQLEERRVAKTIWSSKDAPLEWKQWGGLWGDRAFISAHPEVTQTVATAYVRARLWASRPENKDEIVRAGTANGTPEHIVRRTYDESAFSWKDQWSPLFSDAFHRHYEQAIAYALEKNIIRNPVKADELIDRRFVDKAIKDLQLEDYWISYDKLAGAPAR